NRESKQVSGARGSHRYSPPTLVSFRTIHRISIFSRISVIIPADVSNCYLQRSADLTRYHLRHPLVLSRRRTAGRRYLRCCAGTAQVVTSASPGVSIGACGLGRPARSPHDPRLG